MRAIEFQTKIKNDQIQIPVGVQSELRFNKDKDIRVIVLLDSFDNQDDRVFQEVANAKFLKGYAESDSIYDNY